MSIRWKSYEVYFPTQETSHRLDSPIKTYSQKTQDRSEGQQSVGPSTSHAKLYQSTAFRGARYTWLER